MLCYDDLAPALTSLFLADGNLSALIESRLWEVGSPEMIAYAESINEEPASSHGQFVTFRDVGAPTGRLLGGIDSKMPFQNLEFTCYAKYPADVRHLRRVLKDVIGRGYTGTVSGVPIRDANWQEETSSMEFDETLKMSAASITLLVPYESA